MTPKEVLYQLFQSGQITSTEYLICKELPPVAIKRIIKAIKEDEANRK